MLQSKFAKKSSDFKAQKIFTDRKEPRAVFRDSIAAWDEKPREIINYYGKGGVGKTTLLRNLLVESQEVYAAQKKKSIQNIFVSLDAFEYANPVNILTAIRNGISGDCTLFDYAMTQYYAKARMTIEEIKNKNKFLSPTVTGILNEVVSMATTSAVIPVTLIGKIFSLIKDSWLKDKYREDIEEIGTLSEFELFERLPYYLGICINHASTKNKYHVVFLDSYESLLNRTVGGTPSVGQEDWLQEFFLSCENIRIVIASRDRMRWDKQDADWAEFFNQHRLNDLSDEDSRWFLQHVPVTEPEAVDAIVARTAGMPLYLDMCVDIYAACKNSGTPFDIASMQNGDAVIDRYMRHLASHDRYAVKVIAVPRCFELPFALRLLKMQNLVYTADELADLLDKSIFLPIADGAKIYKVDESIRNHLLARMDDEQKCSVLENILDCISSETGATVYPYFGSALETLTQNPVCFDKLFGKIFALTDFYANAGFWRELRALLSKHLQSSDAKLRALAVIAELTYQRRSGNMDAAQACIAEHPVAENTLGEWQYLYRYLCIQIRHLAGHYDECLSSYRALLGEMDLVRHTVPDHVYTVVALKYADLLFLKGDFATARAQAEALLASNNIAVEDRLELIRIKGHTYRFQRQTAEAEKVYSSALRLIEENGMLSHRGKLYTNLTETLCTSNPLQAVEWYKKSEEENMRLQSHIELGKTYAAASAAYTTAQDVQTGLQLARQALTEAQQAGYRSGQAFALAAMAYAHKQAGNAQAYEDCYAQLSSLLDELNVYKYLLSWFSA